jgi:hypothetical protein
MDMDFSSNHCITEEYFFVALQIKESEKELDLELKETRSLLVVYIIFSRKFPLGVKERTSHT